MPSHSTEEHPGVFLGDRTGRGAEHRDRVISHHTMSLEVDDVVFVFAKPSVQGSSLNHSLKTKVSYPMLKTLHFDLPSRPKTTRAQATSPALLRRLPRIPSRHRTRSGGSWIGLWISGFHSISMFVRRVPDFGN